MISNCWTGSRLWLGSFLILLLVDLNLQPRLWVEGFRLTTTPNNFYTDCRPVRAKMDGDKEECKSLLSESKTYLNLPILGGVHCYNNGSGLCKAFAGRFEFMFDIWNDKMIGPVGESEFVDKYGLHKRIPYSYNMKGDILYVDRPINWARQIKKTLRGRDISLYSASDINWCLFVEGDLWPYTSVIRDYESEGNYLIYFYNRQACVLDTRKTADKFQQFNTRFQYNSSLRIDLDMNPIMFTMEDRLAGNKIRLVKHKRQHWYEMGFKVVENPEGSNKLRYFVTMIDTAANGPQRFNQTSGPILSSEAYRNFSELCLDDSKSRWVDKNANLVISFCGYDNTEVSDLFIRDADERDSPLEYGLHLHNIPRYPKDLEHFYGLDFTDENWSVYAADGLVFTATTMIKLAEDRYRVLSLYAKFDRENPGDDKDELNPMPMFADYTATYNGPIRGGSGRRKRQSMEWWDIDRNKKEIKKPDLNYVDDIAYLHECKTVLVIYGPLYSESTVDDLFQKRPVDSIHKLSIFELATAFFNWPGTTELYVYHRLNYIQKLKYTCAGSPGTGPNLVTATKVGSYIHRLGKNPPYHPKSEMDDYCEEKLFSDVQVLKAPNVCEGSDAPDPLNYPFVDEGIGEASAPEDNSMMLYIIIAVAIIIILVMCLICTLTIRRRRLRKMREARTMRSGMSGSAASSAASQRSSWFPSLFGGGSSIETGRSSQLTNNTKLEKSKGSRETSRSSGLLNSKPSRSRTSTLRSKMTGKSSKPSSSGVSKSSSKPGSSRGSSTRSRSKRPSSVGSSSASRPSSARRPSSGASRMRTNSSLRKK